ncbi:hypothetical protein ACRB68_33850 [Actinomadura sp. RB68]|uniref:Transposase IS110-like N-terminal domain-containing protein n=2 Tax=Actinomadura macrotermitis TaxID=2585200 RepID=A0A7K0BWN9_9ACTN|nr:hypothetical protein [Actinomadura macrotermitis]
MRLFMGDDWAGAHHNVELMDAAERRLVRARLPEDVAGMTWLHQMIADRLGDSGDDQVQMVVGIETDCGPWMRALVAAGYTVLTVNPLQAARYRERLSVSGTKSDVADVHMPADTVRGCCALLGWPSSPPRP